VRYEPNDDELMDAVFVELQIQINVCKAAATPMLERHDVAGLRGEFALPPHVRYAKVFRDQAAFRIGAMYFQDS
jgi:hypothetical protein